MSTPCRPADRSLAVPAAGGASGPPSAGTGERGGRAYAAVGADDAGGARWP